MNGDITDVAGIRVGHAQNTSALTGVTVVLCEQGAVAGCDVRGSAPGTRETDLLRPGNLVREIHAVVLTGGSAYGLDACCGVMRYLESRKVGYDMGTVRVPIVSGAVIFDLGCGDPRVRPDAEMGFQACAGAGTGPIAQGNAGAGTGATVGKMFGMEWAMKGGTGSASTVLGNGVTVGAIVVVNSFGDVMDPNSGNVLAGARNPVTGGIAGTTRLMLHGFGAGDLTGGCSTTIGVVATDASLTKEEVNKVSQMAHDGFARSINPVHTMYDGDTIFCLSLGRKSADVNTIGVAAAELMARAIVQAVLKAETTGRILSAQDMTAR
ncbi:MAG: P1 family peptidase [Bacillota bacterium]|nr:P1 family peptidase [Bacillota bacterium]